MRITQNLVTRMSDLVDDISDQKLGLQSIGGDIGYGTRYTDRRQQLVWAGKGAGVHAAAYYHGIYEALTDTAIGERPDWLRELGTELMNRSGFEKWHNRGMADAYSFQRMEAEREKARAEQDKIDMKNTDLPIDERRAAFRRHNRRVSAR